MARVHVQVLAHVQELILAMVMAHVPARIHVEDQTLAVVLAHVPLRVLVILPIRATALVVALLPTRVSRHSDV